jgi:hypothetical protein
VHASRIFNIQVTYIKLDRDIQSFPKLENYSVASPAHGILFRQVCPC